MAGAFPRKKRTFFDLDPVGVFGGIGVSQVQNGDREKRSTAVIHLPPPKSFQISPAESCLQYRKVASINWHY